MDRVRSTLPPLQTLHPRCHDVRGTLQLSNRLQNLARSQTRSMGRRRCTIITVSAPAMPTLASLSPRFLLKLAVRQRRARNRVPMPPTRSASGVPSIRKIQAIRLGPVRSNHPTDRPVRPHHLSIVLLDRLVRFRSVAGSYRSHYSTGRSGRTTWPAGRPAGSVSSLDRPVRSCDRSIRLARVRRRGTRTVVLSHRSARASPESLLSPQRV